MAVNLTALPASTTLASRVLRLPASVAGKTLCLLDAAGQSVPLCALRPPASAAAYTAGNNIAISSGNVISVTDLPRQAALLTTRTEDLAAATVYDVTAADLNTSLTLRIYSDVYVNLPPPAAGAVPALLRIENEAAGSATNQLTVAGRSRPVRNGDYMLLAALAAPGQGTQWVEISSSAQLLDPLSYPVMVGTQSLGYVGYSSLEAACFAAPFRPLVLNVPYLLLENDLTLTGNLSAAAQAALVLGPGVTLTVNVGVQLQNINVQRFNSSGQKVVVASTQGGVTAAWQGIQLVDSRIGPDLYFADATHLVAARGRSRVDAVKGGPGTLYLFDVATVISTASAPSVNVVDLRPGAGFLPNVAAEPATPVGGGVLYVQNGALKYKGSGGTVTPLALA